MSNQDVLLKKVFEAKLKFYRNEIEFELKAGRKK